jgi:predicted helicase
MARIFHANLYGNRKAKYDCLLQSDISKTAWLEVLPQSPFHLLIPQSTEFLVEYEHGWKVTDAMPLNSTGARTHRDNFVMDFDFLELRKRIEDFRNLDISDHKITENYNIKDTRDWKLGIRRQSLSNNKKWGKFFTKTLYRPFDFREYYHHADVVEFPRNEIVGHLFTRTNFALLWTRPLAPSYEFSVLVSDCIPHQCVIGNKNAGAGASYIAPLYRYSASNDFQSNLQNKSELNFSRTFLNAITAKLGYTPTPEAIFYYIYAIFHSPTYRSRYAEFLKIDFPRVPLTRNDDLFRKLAAYGEQLVALHLMKSPQLEMGSGIDREIGRFPQFVEQGGQRTIDPAHPKYANGKVTINKKGDGFVGVPEAVWNFYVGGYPVCAKWLKDRKGRNLSQDDIAHYQRIVVALQETITLMAAIDQTIPGFPID